MKFPHLLAFCLIIASCAGNDASKSGIVVSGPYPGNPEENAAPSLKKDKEFRNIALSRVALASSSFDYNLTAQLATDGIVEDVLPAYIELSTSKGPVPVNERGWMFDFKSSSGFKFEGSEEHIDIAFRNYELAFDRTHISGQLQVTGEEGVSPFWTITLQGSADGSEWSDLDSAAGVGDTIFSDLNKTEVYDMYRLVFKADHEVSWNIEDWDFMDKDVTVELGRKPEPYNRASLTNVAPEFHSAWMSAGDGEEWIYVDLGTKASVKGVILHWIDCQPEGEIQVSDDARNWKKVAAVADEAKFSAKARYVRLLLKSGGPYVLSEFEVMGKGGLVASAKPQPAADGDRLDLTGGSWKLERANLVEAAPEVISSNGFDASSWMAATVPGTVLTSYINAGAVPDPNYSDNQLQISESYFLSDFWYRDEFVLPEGFAKERLFLNFDGINWKAEVYVNGSYAGRIDGAFTRARFDVTDMLAVGSNSLAVKIIKNAFPGTVKEQTALSADSNGGVLGADNPTFHATIGWDWIPTIRGRDMGIWNDVFITTTGAVTIEDPFVRAELNLPDTTKAFIFAEALLKNHSDKPVHGVLHAQFGPYPFSQAVDIPANGEFTVKADGVEFPNPRLWWPKGYGEPYLYDVKVDFECNGAVSDCKSFKTGVRQMTFSEEGGILNLYVNGRRFIGRGGNWGFAESNLNYRAREYDIAVRYHADMNFTMIRNWVGQVGDDEFFEACDRHGVMVWQDFWLANPWDGPDPYDEAMFLDNAKDFVKRLRNHPSIGLYCGRNEGMPTNTLDAGFDALVADLHPGIHYTPHSAAGVVSGGGPYRALPIKQYFDLFGADKFHSERGMPNVMNYEDLIKAIPEDKVWPQSSLWGLHDFTLESAQHSASFNEMVENGFGWPESAREFCDLAQWINYNGYRAMFEGRSKYRHGLLLWMSHPAWPSMVWQTYDYYFEPTAAYFGCKKASEPLHIQYNALTGKVEVVNLSGRNARALKAQAQLLDMYGRQIDVREAEIVSDEDTTIECFDVEVPEDVTDVYYVKLTLMEGDRLVSENFYWEGKETGNWKALRELPQADVKVTTSLAGGEVWKGEVKLENTSDVPALMLRVKLAGKDGSLILPVMYSDNYFFLMPGESRTVSVEFNDFDLAGRTPQIEVSGFNVK